MAEFSETPITMRHDRETNTVSIHGITAHSMGHIFDALATLGGLARSNCVVSIYNMIAAAYNDIIETIPEESLMSIEDSAEKLVRDVQMAMVLGLEEADSDEN